MSEAADPAKDELEKMKLLLSSEYAKLNAEIAGRINSQQQLYVMVTPIVTLVSGAYSQTTSH
ncbi:hypothetical protein ACVIGB_008677 [Bradyrhizobium sp. USDA 4341]